MSYAGFGYAGNSAVSYISVGIVQLGKTVSLPGGSHSFLLKTAAGEAGMFIVFWTMSHSCE